MTAVPNSVLGKAVALLNAYEPGDESLSLAELHRRTGIPKTTLHRLLGELGEWKVLERTRRGYRLGMRMFEWGQLVSVQRSLCDAAAPFLACLSEATRATVNLAVPEGPDVVYIQKINALDEPRRPHAWAAGCRCTARRSARSSLPMASLASSMLWYRADWSGRPHAQCATWSSSVPRSSACGRAASRRSGRKRLPGSRA
ncbi:hypothetical protein SSPO_022890 [Streptomyces antimycoticus]|uniref:HTH iclR-type domain-containing protein n=1 Tax=Streptomyces antimycoticus TaxID=68175 RepID=A0A499UQR5_9ACTN|nr:hypothetical protein SSPO_022890 [Streptomyces antimycoticus]